MKNSLKKSVLLLGVAFAFVLTALAYPQPPGYFGKGSSEVNCLNGGSLRVFSETATAWYGYCECADGFWGPRCEYKEEE